MRFDYLHDAPPDAVERLRAICSTTQARGVLSFLATAVGVLVCAGSLEAMHLREARAALAEAQARLDRSTAAMALVDSQARALHSWIALDRRLREVRVSGALAAARVTRIANNLPARMWLTSMTWASDGYDVTGRAVGLDEVGHAIDADPAIRLLAVHASDRRDSRIVDFKMHVPTP